MRGRRSAGRRPRARARGAGAAGIRGSEPHRSTSSRSASAISSRCRAPKPITMICRRSRSRRNVAARTSVSRSCACPTFPECMTTNESVTPCSRAQSFSPRLRPELVGVDPVRDHLDPLRRRALLLQAQLHRLADGDHPVRPAKVERHEAPERAEHEWLLEPLDALGDLGEHVLADHEERYAEPPRDEEPDVTDHGRIGHAEHEVGPCASQRREHRVAEVCRVVGGAQVELRSIVRGRTDTVDPHPVSHFCRREVMTLDAARHDGDVVVGGERLTELGEELRGRLDARPVVLVEDEDPAASLRHGHRGRNASRPRLVLNHPEAP